MTKDGRMDNVFGTRTITLMDNELLSTSANISTKTLYGAIQKIEYDNNLTYLFISPMSAHIIPDSAFNDNITKDMFIDALNSKLCTNKESSAK